MRRTLAVVVVLLLVSFAAPVTPQMAFRLKGVVRATTGAPVASARVRADAIAGFRGEPFTGQKEFSVATNERGEWSILGLTSGIWVLQASAPELLPQAMVLAVEFANRKPVSAIGGALKWDVPFSLGRLAEYAPLQAAVDAYAAGRGAEVNTQLGTAAGALDPIGLAYAGEIALGARQLGMALALFERALERGVEPRALTGLAGALLMQGDYSSAARQFWNARERAPRDLRPALGATIADLQQISRPH